MFVRLERTTHLRSVCVHILINNDLFGNMFTPKHASLCDFFIYEIVSISAYLNPSSNPNLSFNACSRFNDVRLKTSVEPNITFVTNHTALFDSDFTVAQKN